LARDLDPDVQSALEARSLVARDFLWFVARDRDTLAPVSEGTWSDVGDITAQVINPDTGLAEDRVFYGSGTLIQCDDVPLVSNMTVQNMTVRMSQIHEAVEQLVRDYDVKQARVELYRGLFDPATRKMVAPAFCRFVGFVDSVVINTPSENEDGSVVLTCTSHTQEITRSNPDTRSHASQVLRSATDNFFVDASVVGTWEHWWGKKKGPVQTNQKPKGLFGWGNFLGFL
jgi:hypothetical protein